MFNPSVTITFAIYKHFWLKTKKNIASFKFFAKLFIGLLEDRKETELQNISALLFRISFRIYILEYHVLGYFFSYSVKPE